MNFITTFIEASKKQINLGTLLILVAIGFNYSQIHQLQQNTQGLAKAVATEYAFDVIAYGFKGAQSDEEILKLVAQWHRDEWGAQIGALQTLCDVAPRRLDGIVGEQLATRVCRIT